MSGSASLTHLQVENLDSAQLSLWLQAHAVITVLSFLATEFRRQFLGTTVENVAASSLLTLRTLSLLLPCFSSGPSLTFPEIASKTTLWPPRALLGKCLGTREDLSIKSPL